MKLADAMNELARAAGIGPVVPDGDGSVTFLFDGEHEVTFSPEPDGCVVLQCEIGDAETLADGACRALLEASYSETGGAAFAIHRTLGKAILWKRHGEFESTAALEKAVNGFLGQVVAWKKKIAGGDLGTAGSVPDATIPIGFPGGFIVV